MDRVVSRTPDHYTSIEMSEDRKTVAVFHGYSNVEGINKVAEFSIMDLWDMCRDNLAVADVGPSSNFPLWRRKAEAIAAITVKGIET